MTWVKGLDASFSRVDRGWCERRKAEGVRVFVQCLWAGGYANNAGVRAVAEANLRAAREAGLVTAGYLNTNPWFPATTSLLESKENAGAEWDNLKVVFNDIEIAGVTEAQCKAHCEAIVAEGKDTAIYSAKWFWDSIGNPQWPWLKAFDVWVADYDNDPSFATATLFGPWNLSDVIGKQYTNTTLLDGVNVDLNEFADEFFEEDDMGMTVEEHDWLLLAVQSAQRADVELDTVIVELAAIKALCGSDDPAMGGLTEAQLAAISKAVADEIAKRGAA